MAKNKFNASMFDKIKDALKKTESTGNAAYLNIMKFPAGHTYSIRLIPNVDNVDDTFFHHFVNSWKSNSTGGYISALSLQTFKERDPISELRWKLYKAWKAENPNPGKDSQGNDIKFKGPIEAKEQWYVNALWVDNPAEPELNGQVRVLKMGPQIKDIVDLHMSGERAEEYGSAIFDLSKEGADLKIVAEEQGEYTTFKKSYFTFKSKLNLSEEEIDAVYESVHDLKQIQPVKTFDELTALLDEHFFCDTEKKNEERSPLVKPKASKPKPEEVEVEEEDEIPMEWVPKKTPVKEEKKVKKPSSKSTVDDDVDDLIAGLDMED